MNFEAGICPKCKEYILLKNNVPFLVCPMCGQSISSQEGKALLAEKCRNKDCTNELIADCVALEMQYGPELPFMILAEIVDNFPQLESPAYLLTKVTGYDVGATREYLKTFAEIKSDPSNVPWAEEFLDNCLNYQNMELADLFVSYIKNKIRKEKQEEYLKKVTNLKKEYTFKANDPNSTKWLLAIYLGSTILNVLLFPCFMLLSGAFAGHFILYFSLNMSISVLAVCLEVGLMFIHQRIYGNRLGMSQRERNYMVAFMASIVFVLGAAVMGSFWQIKL